MLDRDQIEGWSQDDADRKAVEAARLKHTRETGKSAADFVDREFLTFAQRSTRTKARVAK